MIDPNGIMPLNFFKYKGVYTGQHNGMRYMLKQTGEKPDLKLSACVWRGPYASCAVKEEDKTTEIFELTEDGRLAAVEWIRQQYESRLDYWEAASYVYVCLSQMSGLPLWLFNIDIAYEYSLFSM